MTDNIRPFTLAIEDTALDDLRRRLDATRWPEAETCDSWDQGMPLDYSRELAAYWARDYDWRRCEKTLNSWPNYQTTIQDIDIHFIHRPSSHPHALPLIISHGWPGSVIEFSKIIDALAQPELHGGDPADAFHVVAPSLPGFGFSGKSRGTGTGVEKIGRMWGELMARLGYERYVAQGGDWGSMITQSMGQTETTHCAGIHVNMPIVAPDPDTMDDLSPLEQSALDAMAFYNAHDSGYSRQQSTRPQTLAYGLADSPVGQMAWIVEKFYAWTDCEKDGVKHPEHVLSKDELLDNVMLYWLNNCAASSARLYWESFNSPNLEPIAMPVGCSIFPCEIFRCSRRWAEKRFSQLIHWNELDQGGHFAAFEQPEVFVQELRNCFRQLR
ncbi:alpha/beta fold hydrolase [Seongchinamella sediminis]|uniref:Alpha/beta fold hydrolase n=1 Tax=Seongchinamella sediminis TaxID=2283635 RepID=A0A3L7E452_9GAMM|nr:epoxide hydrolase family protein [Seongchinamella sediminis]RLQ23231.1 alpha/beta fold hydrolase [Seongchinamella sediminis]